MIYTTDLSFVTGKQASKQGNILLDLLSPSIRSISGLKIGRQEGIRHAEKNRHKKWTKRKKTDRHKEKKETEK